MGTTHTRITTCSYRAVCVADCMKVKARVCEAEVTDIAVSDSLHILQLVEEEGQKERTR